MIKSSDTYFLTYQAIDEDGRKIIRKAFNYQDPREVLAKIKELGLEFLTDLTIHRRHAVTLEANATLDDLREVGCTDADLDEMLPYLR